MEQIIEETDSDKKKAFFKWYKVKLIDLRQKCVAKGKWENFKEYDPSWKQMILHGNPDKSHKVQFYQRQYLK
jgi:hypothetical protein